MKWFQLGPLIQVHKKRLRFLNGKAFVFKVWGVEFYLFSDGLASFTTKFLSEKE